MVREGSLRRGAASLALAGGVEFGLQTAMPIILVRYLDQTAFGQYRLLWLLANTAFAIAPAFMPQSLFYFLARAEPGQKGIIVGNVLIFLISAGCVVGVAASGWNPWLQTAAGSLFFETHGISALFLAFSVVGLLLDMLPMADGRARWQANAVIFLALLRTVLVAIAAVTTADILWVAFAMLVLACIKIALLAYYIRSNVQGKKIGWDLALLRRQLIYAFPFAIGNGLFLLRVQADQWVVLTMLSPALLAVFANAAAVMSLATLIRQPVYNAMMPRLNAAHSRGDLAQVARLIASSTGATALFLIPIVGGLFVSAPQLVEILYTSQYAQTAPIMQVYLIGLLANVFAVGHVLPVLDKGRFAAINSAFCLVVSVVLSIVGVRYWGLIGAAYGSMLTLAIGELFSLRVVAHAVGKEMHKLLAWSSLWPAVLGTCVAVVGVTALTGSMKESAFLLLLFKSALYISFFMPCFIFAGGHRRLGKLIEQYR